MEGNDLEDGSNGVAEYTQPDGFLTTEFVTESESREGTEESTKLARVRYCYVEEGLGSVGHTAKHDEVIPEILGSLVSGKCFLKSAEIKTPENTP